MCTLVCVCMCVYMYIYVCVCMYVRTHMHGLDHSYPKRLGLLIGDSVILLLFLNLLGDPSDHELGAHSHSYMGSSSYLEVGRFKLFVLVTI